MKAYIYAFVLTALAFSASAAQQTIVGTDTLPQGATKINANFTELYDGKQPLDADLTEISAISAANDDFIQRKAGAWINRTMAQLKTDLALAANPTATVGLTAVNGSASTFLRSDGAPALNLTVAPTWTGTHTFFSVDRSIVLEPSNTFGTLFAAMDSGITGTEKVAFAFGRSQTVGNAVYFRWNHNNGAGYGDVTTFNEANPFRVSASDFIVTSPTHLKKGLVTYSASETVAVGGVSYTNTTQTGNTAATETDAFSHTVTASTLGTNGDSLEFEAAGTFANTASTDKRIKVVFGSTTVFDSGAIAVTTAQSWNLKGVIVRTGAATQKVTVTLTTSYASLPATSAYTAATETLTNALTLKLTVNGTNASDTVAQFYKERWSPFM